MATKICIVTTVHHHDDVRIYHKEAVFLARQGYKVVILCRDNAGQDDEGIFFRPVSLPKTRFWRILMGAHRTLAPALEENADLYHLHDPELLPLGKALAAQGKRVVYDAHEDLPRQLMDKYWIPGILRPLVSKGAGRYLQHAVKRFSGVVGATAEIADKLGGIPFCNFPSQLDLPQEEYQSFLPYQERPMQVAYIGAITPSRGIFSMLETVQLAGVDLQLAGSWENQALLLQAHQQPGWEHAHYSGVLPRNGVYSLLGSCRAGLLLLQPTQAYQRSMPIKLFEYLLAGLPVIASDFPMWRELAGDSCLYVPPNRPDLAAEAIQWLKTHPEEGEEMGRRGREMVCQKYLLEGEQQRLLQLYQGILKEE